MSCYIVLDIGGTEIKAGLLDEQGELMTKKIITYPSLSNGTKEVVLQNFSKILRATASLAKNAALKGIGMAFPGPFDYQSGVSYITGLNKYAEIYGVNLRTELAAMLANDYPFENNHLFENMVFLHDIEAFALGECIYGAAKQYDSVFCLCIGTGAGSAYFSGGKVLTQGKDIPENGWIYNIPFKESIVDDYISARGLQALGFSQFQKSISGKELYSLALQGNKHALTVFQQFGENARKAVELSLRSFSANAILLGGQITNSFDFWGSSLKNYCQKNKIDILLSSNTSLSAFKGLYSILTTK